MRVDRKDAEASLPKKGFTRDARGDHVYFLHTHKGRRTGAYTKISHSAKMRDISGSLLRTMQKQLRLEHTRQAVELLRCPMDGEEYLRILIQRGIVPSDDSRG